MSTNTTGEVSENATALDPPFENQDTANEPESETAGAKSQAATTLPRKAKATREKGRGNARSRRLALLHSEAAKFPNGPAAKALASAEPRMPREVQLELANASDAKLLTESFQWLMSRIRDYHRPSKGAKAKALYPANLIREYRDAYGKGLLYLPVPKFGHHDRGGRLVMPRSHRDLMPKTGSRDVSVVAVPHHALTHAALAGVVLPGPFPTPLARLHRIGAEAQAAWVYWLWQRSASRLRSQLLASLTAWQVAERCKVSLPP